MYTSRIFIAVFHCLSITQFVIHSPADEYLGYLQFRSIMNEAAKDIYVLFFRMYPVISLGIYLGVYFLGQ